MRARSPSLREGEAARPGVRPAEARPGSAILRRWGWSPLPCCRRCVQSAPRTWALRWSVARALCRLPCRRCRPAPALAGLQRGLQLHWRLHARLAGPHGRHLLLAGHALQSMQGVRRGAAGRPPRPRRPAYPSKQPNAAAARRRAPPCTGTALLSHTGKAHLPAARGAAHFIALLPKAARRRCTPAEGAPARQWVGLLRACTAAAPRHGARLQAARRRACLCFAPTSARRGGTTQHRAASGWRLRPRGCAVQRHGRRSANPGVRFLKRCTHPVSAWPAGCRQRMHGVHVSCCRAGGMLPACACIAGGSA